MLASPRMGSSCSVRSHWMHERGGRHHPLQRPEPRRVAPVAHTQTSWARPVQPFQWFLARRCDIHNTSNMLSINNDITCINIISLFIQSKTGKISIFEQIVSVLNVKILPFIRQTSCTNWHLTLQELCLLLFCLLNKQVYSIDFMIRCSYYYLTTTYRANKKKNSLTEMWSCLTNCPFCVFLVCNSTTLIPFRLGCCEQCQ